MSGWFLLLSCFAELSELNANSVDPDQMPHSDLGLLCLSMSLYGTLGLNGLSKGFCYLNHIL